MSNPIKKSGLVFYDLTNPLAHGVPQWPSSANLNIRTMKFHANDGVLVRQYEGIFHRTTHMDAEIGSVPLMRHGEI